MGPIRSRIQKPRVPQKSGAQVNKYEYAPLCPERREIRLLDLYPDRAGKPLKGELKTVSLDASPVYETVSYVWGPAIVSTQLQVGTQFVKIPKGTEAVLQRVRQSDQRRRIWVDAVCIDQSNVAERGQQVALMGEIYAFCEQNLVYLGEGADEDTCKQIARLVTFLNQDARVETNDFENFRETVLDLEPRAATTSTTTDIFVVRGEVIDSLLSLPWFRRLWVVQEAVLSQKNLVYLGRQVMDFLATLRAVEWYRYKFNADDLFEYSKTAAGGRRCMRYLWEIKEIQERMTSTGRISQLYTLLDLAADFEKSEPRDGVFATLGLLANVPHELALPDYTVPLPTLLATATRVALEPPGNLTLLQWHHLRAGDLSSMEMPSWAWRADRTADVTNDPAALGDMYDTSHGLTPHERLPHSEMPEVLSIEGLIVESVAVVSQACPSSAPLDWMIEVRQLFRAPKARFSERSLSRIFAYTMCVALTKTGRRLSEENGLDVIVRFLTLLPTSAAAMEKLTPKADGELDSALLDARNVASFSLLEHRSFFVTQSGRPGLGPRVMCSGDIVVVLRGGRVPFILRPMGEVFRFVGPAYVHGIMDGEAVDTHMAAGGTTVVFNLR